MTNTITTQPTDSGESTDSPGQEPRTRPVRARRIKQALGVSALALVVGGGFLWLNATSDVHTTGAACADVTGTGAATAAERDAVCATLASLVDAWDAHDAEAYGALFTEDATYTTFVGTHYQGRQDIADAHEALFAGFLKDTRLADSILDIRFLTADTAVVTSRGDTYTGDRPAARKLSKVQTYTLVRRPAGQWQVAAFHNTKRRPVMERISFLFSPDTRPVAERS